MINFRQFISLLNLYYHNSGPSYYLISIFIRDLFLDIFARAGSDIIGSLYRGLVARLILGRSGFVLLAKGARILRPDCINLGSWVWIKDGATLFGSGPMSIGNQVVICERASIWSGPDGLGIGNYCWIGIGSFLAASGGRLQIGDYTLISDHCSIYTVSHLYDSLSISINEQGGTSKPVIIGSHVLIGSGARVMPGVTIGDYAIIGAGAVVTRDVAPKSIVAGVPARHLRYRDSAKSGVII